MPSETVKERIIEEDVHREQLTADPSLRANVAAADTSLAPKSKGITKAKIGKTKKSKTSKKSKLDKAKSTRITEPTYVKIEKEKAQRLFNHRNSTPLWSSNTNGKSITISQDPTIAQQNPISNLVGSVAARNGVQNAHVSNIIQKTASSAIADQNASNLTPHGKILAKDTQNILLSADRLFMEKNQGQKLQNFAKFGAKSVKQNIPVLQSKRQGVSTTGIQKKTRSAASYIQRLGYTFVKSGDLRDIVSQFVTLFKELANNGSTPGSSSLNAAPSMTEYSTSTTVLPTTSVPSSNYSSYVVNSTASVIPPATNGVSYGTNSGSRFDLEKKQRLSSTLNSLLSRLGSRHEYRKAVKDSFKLYDSLYGKASYLKEEKAGLETDHASAAKNEAWQFAAMWFGEREMKRFKTSSSNLVRDIRRDRQLESFLLKFRQFILYAVENPEGMQTYEKQQESMQIITELEMFMRTGNWGSRFSGVLDDFTAMWSNLRNDSYLTDFGSQLQTFVKDFALNDQGRPDLFVMSESMAQMKQILLPMLRTHLSNIPIDRIDLASAEMDLVLEDLKFNFGEILPSNFKFDFRNKMNFGLNDLSMGKTLHELHIEIRDITPVLNNVKFYVHKKTGFKWLDYGILDLAFRNRGMRIELDYYLTAHKSDGRSATLKLHKIKVGLDDVYMKISKARHGLIDRLALGLGKGMIKKQIVNAVTDALTKSLTTFDAKVNALLAQRPMSKLMNSADQFVERSYYSAQDRKAKAAIRNKRAGTKSNVPFATKLKNGISKAARGIDTVAPTNLSKSNQVAQPSTTVIKATTFSTIPATEYAQPSINVIPPTSSTWSSEPVNWQSAPVSQTYSSVPSGSMYDQSYLPTVNNMTQSGSIPTQSWDTSKAAPVAEPTLSSNSVVTQITETYIPNSSAAEITSFGQPVFGSKLEPTGFIQKQSSTPVIGHIKSA